MMTFKDPIFFILIPVLFFAYFLARKRHEKRAIPFTDIRYFKSCGKSWKVLWAENLPLLRLLALTLVVISLARPQAPVEESKIESEGIDIVLAVDVSGSMLAEDFTLNRKRANRLAVVKEVIKDFVKGRHSDRIGLVGFAGRAYVISPLTLDYGWLIQNVDRLKVGIIEDGTAIGSGLASAISRLKDTEAKGKVIILLTDGRNNTGRITPMQAARIAKALHIKVYTIGAGTKGKAPYPVKDFFGNTVYQPLEVDIDEETLKHIAGETGGKYFRAVDTASLKEIYKEIDSLEKTDIEESGYLEYRELFVYTLLAALGLIVLEIVLSNTVLRKVP